MAKRMQFGRAEHRRTHDAIRTSAEVQAELGRISASVTSELGEGYEAQVTPVTGKTHRQRSRLGIWTYTLAAIRDNARNDSLTRALARRIK